MAKAESKDEGKGAGRQGGEASVKDESDMTEGSGMEGISGGNKRAARWRERWIERGDK
jgi:hypothetical protein